MSLWAQFECESINCCLDPLIAAFSIWPYKEVQHSLTSLEKQCKTQHAEPTETACGAHFQMHEPHYVTLLHRNNIYRSGKMEKCNSSLKNTTVSKSFMRIFELGRQHL